MIDLKTQIRRYAEHLDERVADISPEDILGGLPHRVLITPRRRRGLLAAVTAAGLVLVLIGGAALLSRLIGDQTPPVVTQPDADLEVDVIPAPEDHAFDPEARVLLEEFIASLGDAISVETSLGTWTWRRVEGSLWDLMAGAPERPLPALPEISIAGMQWWHHGWEDGGTAHFGETMVSVIAVGGGVDWNAMYDVEAGWVEARWREEPNLIEIFAVQDFDLGGGVGEHRDMGVLDVIEVSVVPGDPDAVEFRRRDGGELVLRLDATDPAVPVELLVQAAPSCHGFGCPLVLRSLFVEAGDDAGVWVDPPWVGRPVVDARIAIGADGLVLLAVEGTRESPTLRWWASVDGLEWVHVAQAEPVIVPAPGLDGVRLTGDGGRLVVVLLDRHVPELSDGLSVWTSTDGSTWTQARGIVPFAVEVGAVPTSFGWMMPGTEWVGGQPQCVVWVSADGTFWERVPLYPRPLPTELGSQCHGDFPHSPRGEWFDKDTVLANTFDLWSDLALWRGGFDE